MGLIKIQDTLISDDIKVQYHKVHSFAFDAITGRVDVEIASYINQAAEIAGKVPYKKEWVTLHNVQPSPELYLSIQNLLDGAIAAEIPEFEGATLTGENNE